MLEIWDAIGYQYRDNVGETILFLNNKSLSACILNINGPLTQMSKIRILDREKQLQCKSTFWKLNPHSINKFQNEPQQFLKGDMNEMSKTSSTRKRMSVHWWQKWVATKERCAVLMKRMKV